MNLDEARAENDERKAAARDAERLCRHDFLTRPDHEERCVCTPPCSRDYDPMPDAACAPYPEPMYENTGIGALYGLGLPEGLASGLAGWAIVRGSEPE